MIVVFDSNIWLSALGLRSSVAAATKFFIRHQKARVAIPEVVRLEVTRNLSNHLNRHINQIRDDYRQVLTAFGTLRELVLPSRTEVDQKVSELFESLNVPTFDVPFSLASARSSFEKTLNKVAPSDKSQEFKDGVLWADCLELLKRGPVVLVTADKAFYRDRQFDKGLAPNLAEEAQTYPNSIRVVSELTQLLETLHSPVAVDEDSLVQKFVEQFGDTIVGMISKHGFAIEKRQFVRHELFATENPANLFLTFSIRIALTDERDRARKDAFLDLAGDGLYCAETNQFSELRNFGEKLRFLEEDGSLRETSNQVIYAMGLTVGHKEVTHTVRYRIGGAGGSDDPEP